MRVKLPTAGRRASLRERRERAEGSGKWEGKGKE